MREQGIQDIVGVVFPRLAQATLGLREPDGAFGIGVDRLDGDTDMGVLGQREGLERAQQPVFVDGWREWRGASASENALETVAAMR